MTDRLPPYSGPYAEQQETAEECVRRLVERAAGRLVSRQALAVLRVVVDELARLQGQIDELCQKEGA